MTVHTARVHANRVGILAMIGAMAFFGANDALVKYASQSLPIAQIIFVRGLMASTLVLCVAMAMGATRHVRQIAHGWVATRAIMDAVATLLFLASLAHLPIGTATAIIMTQPLMITVFAAHLGSERVEFPVWIATGAGFFGVLLIIQPETEAFGGYAALSFLSAVLMSVRDLATRQVHAGVPSILVTLSATVAVTMLSGALSLFEGLRPIDGFDLGMLAIAAVFLAVAYFLLIVSTRRGDLSLVAPFRYSGLLFATIIGYFVWSDVPNALAWCGIVVLVASGIYVLRASRRARAASPAPD